MDTRHSSLTSLSPSAGGCHNSLKPVSSSPTIAIAAAAAAMVSVDAERRGGPSPSSVQPCHFLTLAPIKIPLRKASFSGKRRAQAVKASGRLQRPQRVERGRDTPALGLWLPGFSCGTAGRETREGFHGLVHLPTTRRTSRSR